MLVSSAALPPLIDYQLRLPSFEGPLDLLLRLIERDQLPITEVSLVAVTRQFLDYIASGRVSPPAMAEFTAVGSRLVLLKSRTLLPRPPAESEDEGNDDLITELIEYQAVKQAAERFAALDLAGSGAFAPRPGAVAAPMTIGPQPLAMHQPRGLARALRRRLFSTPSAPEPFPVQPVVTLREMAERILGHLRRHRSIPFSKVAGTSATRQERLTAFQALLVLVRRRVVIAEQAELFGEITVRGDRQWAEETSGQPTHPMEVTTNDE